MIGWTIQYTFPQKMKLKSYMKIWLTCLGCLVSLAHEMLSLQELLLCTLTRQTVDKEWTSFMKMNIPSQTPTTLKINDFPTHVNWSSYMGTPTFQSHLVYIQPQHPLILLGNLATYVHWSSYIRRTSFSVLIKQVIRRLTHIWNFTSVLIEWCNNKGHFTCRPCSKNGITSRGSYCLLSN